MSLILAFKNRTETMMQCMDRIRIEASIDQAIPMTYAGRLDPMAEGLVVFLCGDLRFQKEKMLKMNKTYRVEFFLGYETDTYDILGIAQQVSGHEDQNITLETITSFQPLGTFVQKFPAYSSRKVEGKPMFVHAKQGVIPTESHNVTIYNYSGFLQQELPAHVLLEHIYADTKKVVGDFRQDAVVASWEKLAPSFSEKITLYEITLSVSSGFYIRQWVSDLGTFLSTGAVTFRIVRDTIGIFTMSMLNGESYRIFYDTDPMIQNLTI